MLGGLSAAVYAVVVWLSWRFEFVDRSLDVGAMYALLRERPIVPVLYCFAVLFGLYLIALSTALKCAANRAFVPTLFGFALGFRLLLLASHPIQEVDIYRYLWDGAVVRAGVSPFRYTPQQVLDGDEQAPLPDDLGRLVELRNASPALREILGRVHFGQLPTVYPAVSQAVFAAASFTTPRQAGVRTRVVIMRCWLLAFDMATVWLLLLILRHVGKRDGWAVAYAWCPLVMKEFANSGHLDSIAVCLTTAAVYVSLKIFYRRECIDDVRGLEEQRAMPTLAAALLAMAVGAKLYPVVLVPLFAVTSLRRLGWRATLLPAATFVVLTGVLCAPMFPRSADTGGIASPVPSETERFESPRPEEVSAAAQDPSRGLSTFLRRWEMNDFLFLILVENINPAAKKTAATQAWFVATPQQGREELVAWVSHWFQLDAARVPFLLTRFVTAGVFLLLALRWSWKSSIGGTGERFLECTFLTLAWFWLLLPTQNPWYWIWALPFVPFARSRVWLAMSGCVLVYYLRFWLGYHWPDTGVAGTGYKGNRFFDFVLTWVEFGPWFVWLAIEYGWSMRLIASARKG